MTNVTRLPGPIADVWDWQRLGLCRGRDSAQFFHPDGERGASRGRRETAAKSVCRACPVRAECAAQALSTREPYGVWGAMTEHERSLIARSEVRVSRAPARAAGAREERQFFCPVRRRSAGTPPSARRARVETRDALRTAGGSYRAPGSAQRCPYGAAFAVQSS